MSRFDWNIPFCLKGENRLTGKSQRTDASASMVIFEFFPFEKIISVPQNATAFANRGAYNNMLFAMGW